jgi:hypothetical protein
MGYAFQLFYLLKQKLNVKNIICFLHRQVTVILVDRAPTFIHHSMDNLSDLIYKGHDLAAGANEYE